MKGRLLPAAVAVLSALVAPAALAGPEEPSAAPRARPGSGEVFRARLGPVRLRSGPPEGRAGSLCLEVWLGSRRMARSCRAASEGQVFFRRIRLESRRGLPILLRVRVGGEAFTRQPDPRSLSGDGPGGDAVLAQALPDLVAPYGEEAPVSPKGRPRGHTSPRSPTGPRACDIPLSWPASSGQITVSCGGWEFQVGRAPEAKGAQPREGDQGSGVEVASPPGG